MYSPDLIFVLSRWRRITQDEDVTLTREIITRRVHFLGKLIWINQLTFYLHMYSPDLIFALSRWRRITQDEDVTLTREIITRGGCLPHDLWSSESVIGKSWGGIETEPFVDGLLVPKTRVKGVFEERACHIIFHLQHFYDNIHLTDMKFEFCWWQGFVTNVIARRVKGGVWSCGREGWVSLDKHLSKARTSHIPRVRFTLKQYLHTSSCIFALK